MDSYHLRLRIDGEIARTAIAMARAQNMELADALRMMLTKAVRIGDFAIDGEEPAPAPPGRSRAFFGYDDSQWAPLKGVLDAELALALVNQFVANRTLEIADLMELETPDAGRIDELTRERDEARLALSTLDPEDAFAIRAVLERYAPTSMARQDAARDDPQSGKDE